jgi:hypothetical protein
VSLLAGNAVKHQRDVPPPVAGAGHVCDGATGCEDEVAIVKVVTGAADVDDTPHDAHGDCRELRRFGGDEVPLRLLRAEECDSERGVGLRGFQVVLEQRFERRPGILDCLGGAGKGGHAREPAADDRREQY